MFRYNKLKFNKIRYQNFLMTFIFASLYLMGCSLNSIKKTTPSKSESYLIHDQQSLLEESQKALDLGQHQQAISKLDQFFKNYPQSTLTQKARLIYAQVLDEQGHLAEAELIYRSVYQITDPVDSVLSLEAMYLLALNYQSQGDDVKELLILADLESRKDRFPRKTMAVEIEARRMQIFNLRGQKKQAMESRHRAEKELKRILPLLNSEEREKDLAQCYYFMGNLSLDKMTTESVINYLEVFLTAQTYLFDALHFDKTSWSTKSKTILFKHYTEFLHIFDLLSENKESLNTKAPTKSKLGAEISNSIYSGFLSLPQNIEKQNVVQKEVFAFLKGIDEHVQKKLYEAKELNPLTNQYFDLRGWK